MQLKPFKLEEWLEEYEHSAKYNLAASTGPTWTLRQLLELMSETDEKSLFETPLTYCPATGRESLRSEIAAMYGASPDDVQIVTGASEALLALFFFAAEPGKNVVVPSPAYPPFLDIPEAFGVELRQYEVGASIEPDAVKAAVNENTKFVLVNTPHNPTGATIEEDALTELDRFTSERGIQLVVDEVYHPIYHDRARRSAGEYLDCTVLGDFSKAFSLAGLRTGWVLERDPARREAFWNARAHFTISNNMPGEILAEVAVRHRETIFNRAREVSKANLSLLDELFREREELLEWVRPAGGMTAFPRLRGETSSRSFCEAVAARGVVLAPGDCFEYPAHFRLGFGACSDGYEEAVDILAKVLEEHALSRVRSS